MSRRVLPLVCLVLFLALPAAAQLAQPHLAFSQPIGSIPAGQSTLCGIAFDPNFAVTKVQLELHLLQMFPDRLAYVGYSVVPAVYGSPRPDVAAIYGQQHVNSGWCATLDLTPGHYVVYQRAFLANGQQWTTQTDISVGSQVAITFTLPADPVLPQAFTVTGAVQDPSGAPFRSTAVYAIDITKPFNNYRWVGWATVNGWYASGGSSGPWSVSGVLAPGWYDLVLEIVVSDTPRERYEVRRQAIRVRVQ